MQDPIILVGVGEIGGVFARGLLKQGHPVYPVTRQMDLARAAQQLPECQLALITVGENDLGPVLAQLPQAWRQRVGLVQNELLPPDWEKHGLSEPTVMSVWFEKKPGQEAKVVMPSPAYGPHAELMQAALDALGLPNRRVTSQAQLRYELIRKNVYILVSNIAGLRTGGTVSELWERHNDLARQVAAEIVAVQGQLVGDELDPEAYINGMHEAFMGDPAHKCTGRSAPARLARALAHADRFGLEVPTLRTIQAES